MSATAGKILVFSLLLLSACAPNTSVIESVNDRINAHSYAVDIYDCRMYARDKYYALVNSGVPRDDIFIVYGVTYDFQPHVVLKVDGYYLDNRYPEISRTARMLIADTAPASSIDWGILH